MRYPGKLTVVSALAALVLGGCSFSAEKYKAVSADALEQQVSDKLEQMANQRPDKVECPQDLKGEVGATVRCVLTAGPDQLGVTVTATSVDDDSVKFDIQVDDQPTG